MKKRIGSLILAMLLVLSLAANALAAGAGSAEIILEAEQVSDKVYVTVYLTANDASNGRIAIEYDPAMLELGTVSTNSSWVTSVNRETEGKVIFAWVGSELAAKEEMLTMMFSVKEDSFIAIAFNGEVKELYNNSVDMIGDATLDDQIILIGQAPEQPDDPRPPVDPKPPVVEPDDPKPPVVEPDDPKPPVDDPADPTEPGKEVVDQKEVTDEEGTVTETTTYDDGSVTETSTTVDGTSATTVTDAEGTVTEVSATVSESAAASEEPVTLPVEMTAASSKEEAVKVEIEIPETVENVTVEIPVTDVTNGTVIVLVHEDGTEEILPSTALTENGLAITVDSSVTVKVVDNTQTFSDTDESWAKDNITFVAAREIFNGTGDGNFSPLGTMTRSMMMTVLARLDGQDTTVADGQDWAKPGIEWAEAFGIDSSRPDENITREEIATMLYLYAGAPATNGDLSIFPDAANISADSVAAMQWAVEVGIFNGMGDGTINPQGEATREQLAKILMQFINL